MRLWLNRTGEVSLHQQLVTQIVLGILCLELTPGQRLPSTRELARRFTIHANTASAAYRELEQQGWVEFRHGSGVYVRATRPEAAPTAELAASQLIAELVGKARLLGVSLPLLRSSLQRWLSMEPPTRWLMVDPDPERRAIVVHEMEQALELPVFGCDLDECARQLDGSLAVVLPNQAEEVRAVLPTGTELTVLQIQPVGPALSGYLPVRSGVLIGVASRWAEFRRIAQTMLTAGGLPPESLMVVDASLPAWKRGLEQTTAIVCDAPTEPQLPRGPRPLCFRLLTTASLAQLKEMESALTEQSLAAAGQQ
jgi:GntR family transcriptional regulator